MLAGWGSALTNSAQPDERLSNLPTACLDEGAAYSFLEAIRWGDSPRCPRCDAADVCRIRSRSGGRDKHWRWFCRVCRKQYTVRTGTVMEQTRLPLQLWCRACWTVCVSRSGITALQLSRETRITPRSARYVLARIHHALTDCAP